MSTITVSPAYTRLLSKLPPKVIRSEAENERYIEALYELENRDALTPEEKELADLLTLLIEDFESKHYELPKASPAEVLAFLMDQHQLTPEDLKNTVTAIEEILKNGRELNTEEIRALSARFHVSPEVFF